LTVADADTEMLATWRSVRTAGGSAGQRFKTLAKAWRWRALRPVFLACSGLVLGFAIAGTLVAGQAKFWLGTLAGATMAVYLALRESPRWHIEKWRMGEEANAERPMRCGISPVPSGKPGTISLGGTGETLTMSSLGRPVCSSSRRTLPQCPMSRRYRDLRFHSGRESSNRLPAGTIRPRFAPTEELLRTRDRLRRGVLVGVEVDAEGERDVGVTEEVRDDAPVPLRGGRRLRTWVDRPSIPAIEHEAAIVPRWPRQEPPLVLVPPMIAEKRLRIESSGTPSPALPWTIR
jgi:hypothetical protein